jgi:DNA-binding transcriptional regulator GbsR (MarR family)
MKLNQKDAKLFKESHNRWLSESNFLGRLFVKKVMSKIKSDKDLQKTIRNADKELEKTRNKIEKISKGDKNLVKKSIPSDVRKYLGFDY